MKNTPSLPELSPEPGRDLKEFGRILFRGRWYLLSALFATVAVAAVFSFAKSPVYEASAELLVEKSKLNLDIADILNPLTSGSRNDIENRIEVIRSDPVLERALSQLAANKEYVALRQLELARDSLFDRVARAFGPANSTDANVLPTLKEVQERLTVRPIRNTDIIEVYTRAGSPREAQILANTIAQAYLDQDAEVTKQTISNVKIFLEAQLEKTKARLEASEAQAVDFQKNSGLELGPDGASKNLIELQKLYMTAQVELKDKEGELQALDKLLDDIKRDLLTRVSDPKNVNVVLEAEDKLTQIKKLQDEIGQLEEERQAYLDSSDYLRAQQTQEQILQRKQAVENAATAQFPALELFPKYEELIKKQLEVAVQIEALKNRVEVIKAKIDEETKKLVDNGLELLRFQRNLDVDKSIYVLLRQEYEKSRIAEAGELGTARVVNWAVEPESPISPKKGLNLLIALLVGLTVGTGLSFLREYLDNTFKNSKEIERELGVTSLGTVFAFEHKQHPQNGTRRPNLIQDTLIFDGDAQDPAFNAYLTVEANLRFSSFDRPLHSLLVTSSVPREGKSTTAANLGLVLSFVGKKTLIVDGDLRKPVFASLFGLSVSKGLSDLALSDISLEAVIQRPADRREILELHLAEKLTEERLLTQKQIDSARKLQNGHGKFLGDILVNEGLLSADDHALILKERRTKLENLYVLPAGTLPPNPTALLGSERMAEIIRELQKRFDLIIFDSPPITAVPDASVLSTKVDGTLMVIEAERTDRDAVRHAVEQLQKAGGQLIGVILNKVHKPQVGYYGSYYGYSYGYGYGRDAEGKRARVR